MSNHLELKDIHHNTLCVYDYLKIIDKKINKQNQELRFQSKSINKNLNYIVEQNKLHFNRILLFIFIIYLLQTIIIYSVLYYYLKG
jgi:hypothetical protein